jgi:hypothetical protein
VALETSTRSRLGQDAPVDEWQLKSESFSQYLAIRCQIPQQERFRLAVIDGFADRPGVARA